MKHPRAIFLGSFAIIGSSLYFYYHIPLLPILLGGALAFGGNALHQRLKKK